MRVIVSSVGATRARMPRTLRMVGAAAVRLPSVTSPLGGGADGRLDGLRRPGGREGRCPSSCCTLLGSGARPDAVGIPDRVSGWIMGSRYGLAIEVMARAISINQDRAFTAQCAVARRRVRACYTPMWVAAVVTI